jgi:predicted nucleotidyltransferase
MAEPLQRVAAELSIPVRTLRRGAAEGLVHGARVSARRFEITLREEAYLRTHWALLRALRAALRTEPNVRLAVLFGSTAVADDDESSDIDVFVALRDPDVGRVAELTGRLSQRLGRQVQLVRLAEAKGSPALMVGVLEQGRVLVDRDQEWHSLRRAVGSWRRLARQVERSMLATLDDHDLGELA